MAVRYTTAPDEMLDAICKRHYGCERGSTEAVLAANPGLAALGPTLPAGVEIELPDLPPAETTPRRASIELFS
jgi:phage tail protein X